MKKVLTIICGLALLFSLTGNANAISIDFDYLPIGYYSSLILPGVTITDLNQGNVEVLSLNAKGGGYVSPINSVCASSWNVGDGLLLDFDHLINSISIVGGDVGGDVDSWTMTAYDNNDNVLGIADTGFYTGADPVNPLTTTFSDYRTLALNLTGIKYVKLIQTSWGTVWDNLEFDSGNPLPPVPEPCTLILSFLGIGLIGFTQKKKILG